VALSRKSRIRAEDALKIHFWAPLLVTLAALPYLKRQNSARIANIAAFGGKVAVLHLGPYCVANSLW
jgi:NAD(P)-dependent dehydrogenase (short-subunit alcohol dehydrogenase family)